LYEGKPGSLSAPRKESRSCFSMFETSRNSVTAPELLNDFARSHGKPPFASFCCTSRRVQSNPRPTPWIDLRIATGSAFSVFVGSGRGVAPIKTQISISWWQDPKRVGIETTPLSWSWKAAAAGL